MTAKQSFAPLNGFYRRKPKSGQATYIAPNTTLPLADDLPHASEELRDGLTRWVTLKEAEREQGRLAAIANAKAEQASTDYRAKVQQALSDGEDPTKVKDMTAVHKATAETHAGHSRSARLEREKLGHALGPILEAEAPTLFGPVDDRIEDAAQSVHGSLIGLRETWATYSRDFDLRRWLSNAAIEGGMVSNYHGSTALPPDVAAALATIEDHVRSLDKLRADEAQVHEFRGDGAA